MVSGRHSKSGAPLLAVDFQLPPTAPSLLYQARLRAGNLAVAGVTVPGAPVFWAGRNANVAWAATPARVMTTDLYRETPNPEVAGTVGGIPGAPGGGPPESINPLESPIGAAGGLPLGLPPTS